MLSFYLRCYFVVAFILPLQKYIFFLIQPIIIAFLTINLAIHRRIFIKNTQVLADALKLLAYLIGVAYDDAMV